MKINWSALVRFNWGHFTDWLVALNYVPISAHSVHSVWIEWMLCSLHINVKVNVTFIIISNSIWEIVWNFLKQNTIIHYLIDYRKQKKPPSRICEMLCFSSCTIYITLCLFISIIVENNEFQSSQVENEVDIKINEQQLKKSHCNLPIAFALSDYKLNN